MDALRTTSKVMSGQRYLYAGCQRRTHLIAAVEDSVLDALQFSGLGRFAGTW